MQKRRILSALLAAAVALTPAASVLADPVSDAGDTSLWDIGKDPHISKDIIDRGMKGSITICKLDNSETGNTSEGNGLYDSSEARDGIPNIIFSTTKVADIVNVTGTAGSGAEVGVYYANLDSGFTAVAEKCGLDVDSYATTINGTNYWTSAAMEKLIEDIKDYGGSNRDSKEDYTLYTAGTWTGETALNDYVEKQADSHAKDADSSVIAKDFAATGSQLGDEARKMYADGVDTSKNPDKGKTVMTNMELGLYLVAETGYYQLDSDGNFQKVYRDFTYDENGVESKNTETSAQKQSNASDAVSNTKEVTNNDQNYNDDTDVETGQARNSAGQRTANNDVDAEDGTQNARVIATPASPFLVSVPMTNIADITKGSGDTSTTYKAGTVWQYDLNVYPKNNMTQITKKAVEDDGDTLTERQDYYIGQNIHQVIYADAPVTMYTKEDNDARRYKEFAITDTMSKGLTFQRVTRVALQSGRIADPDKLSEFDGAVEFDPADYTIEYTTTAGQVVKPATADGAVPNGTQDIRSFSVALTSTGLAKLDKQTQWGQVVVEFDTVLNKDAYIGSQDGRTFNTNLPTLTWRNQNTTRHQVEGNPVHIFTYELDLTKTGTDTKGSKDINGRTVAEDHEFNTEDVVFTVQQNKQYNPDLQGNSNVQTDLAYMLFVKESDGVYHVWTPSDGAITSIVTADTLKNANGEYEKTAVGESLAGKLSGKTKTTYSDTTSAQNTGDEKSDVDYSLHEDLRGYGYKGSANGLGSYSGIYGADNTYGVFVKDGMLMTTDTDASKTIEVTQLLSPAAGKDGDGAVEEGKLIIKGLDSETYTITEKTTSKGYNLLKNRFDITLNSTDPKDGIFVKNASDIATDVSNSELAATLEKYGAAITMDNGSVLNPSTKVVPMTHENGVAYLTVNNYKTITLHTGGNGVYGWYILAGCLGAGAVVLVVMKKKKKIVAA